MATSQTASALTFPKLERTVKQDFWTALKRFAGRLPFVEDLAAAYYCALDPATPMRVRGTLLAALAYFIFRWRYRPLTLLWRGLAFTDDAPCSPPYSGSHRTSSLSIARQQRERWGRIRTRPKVSSVVSDYDLNTIAKLTLIAVVLLFIVLLLWGLWLQ